MRLFPPLRKDLSRVFYVSLASWCALFQSYTLFITVAGSTQILNTKYRWWKDDGNKGYIGPEDATMLTFMIILFTMNLCGLLGIMTKWSLGLKMIDLAFIVTLLCALVTIVTALMMMFYTGCGFGGGGLADIGKYMHKDLSILAMHFLVVALAWHTMSGIKSLRQVMYFGGSGWEKLNYIEIKTAKRNEAYLDVIE